MKDIPGYDGHYQITEDGEIWSVYSQKFMSVRVKRGYKIISLYQKGKVKTCFVHRLVALTYIPNPENKPTVDHINRDKLDNRVENLRWATMEEQNENRDMEYILQCLKIGNILGAQKVSRPVEMRDKDDHDILYKTFPSSLQAAIQEFGDREKNSLINRCANGKKKSAYGYWWCFI